jgi:hypothetical protein
LYFCQAKAFEAKKMTTESKQQTAEGRDSEILFSRTVKAGQRIYYIDVKRNRKDELYLSITESKKMLSGPQEMPQVSYEKHKIFLFREDFGKFEEALRDAFGFVSSEGGDVPESGEDGDAIKLDLEF